MSRSFKRQRKRPSFRQIFFFRLASVSLAIIWMIFASIWSERAMNPRQQASQSQMHISFSKCQNGKPPSVFSEFKLEMYSNDEGRQRNATTQKRRRRDRIQFQRWIIYRLGAESGNVIEVGVFWLQKLRLIGRLWTDVAKFLGDLWPRVKLKVYQISANLIHRELRNATFEGEKMPTLITLPDIAIG